MQPDALRVGLRAWQAEAEASGDPERAAIAAAEALAADPWAVVAVAGTLARARLARATTALTLDASLSPVPPDHRGAIAQIAAGAPYPAADRPRQRAAGAYDTPRELTRRVVALARQAAHGPVQRGLDLSCGAGAFLVAMCEAGLPEVRGLEQDPIAAAVAERAAPRATVLRADGLLSADPDQDLVVGNPPFVPSSRQDRAQRQALLARFPWLKHRFDLAVPFAEVAVSRARPGGGVALVLPASLFCQPYAEALRRRWVSHHAIHHLASPLRFPSARVEVGLVALTRDAGPAPLPDFGLAPASWATLAGAPWNPNLHPGDPEIVAAMRARSTTLGALCEVDTGVVSHGPDGGKARLLHDAPAPGLLPYVDAVDLLAGRRRWLDYQPARMHRPKSLALFAAPKLLVQRIGIVRAWVDHEGLIAGHTLTVVRPRRPDLPLARLAELLAHPAMLGLLRLERGARLDLYPRDLAALPVPLRWFDDDQPSLEEALDLSPIALARLVSFADIRHCPPGR